MAEEFLVKRNAGAIAYIGLTSKSEQGGWPLDKYFFERYSLGDRTLGIQWKNAMAKFVTDEVIPRGMDYYRFIHIHKVMPYGDPSLKVGGAFTNNLSGNVYDGSGGPLVYFSRHRMTGDVTVPVGERLTMQYGASCLFEAPRKITAYDTGSGNGLVINGDTYYPVCLISMPTSPESEDVVGGMKVNGQLRLMNGGSLKIY